MASTKTSGTQTAVVSTEHTLATVTDDGNYALYVDCKNLVNGDRVRLRTKLKTLTGSTSAVVYDDVYEHAQADIVKISLPVTVDFEVVYTLEQEAGTARSFEWAVMQLD